MSFGFYLMLVCGAAVVMWALPNQRRAPRKLMALAGALVLGLLIAALPEQGGGIVDPESEAAGPGIYYYIFTFISLFAAAMVITHPRPVYSALYFVIVVLSSAALLVQLQAEFMAFAMVIIYGGAILVTYMFVIMLATLPQSEHEPETAALYDRVARQPVLSVLTGFTLVAALGGVLFGPDGAPKPPDNTGAVAAVADAGALPGKFKARRIEGVLKRMGLLQEGEHVYNPTADVQLDAKTDVGTGVILVRKSEGTAPRRIALKRDAKVDERRELIEASLANIDQVGLNLFRGHTLGIELAGVILLLAMVGAIVISRRPLPTAEGGRPS